MQTRILILILPLMLIFSCEEEEKPLPRPIGQLRVEFPKHEYKPANVGDCNYFFEIPLKSELIIGMDPTQVCHKNLAFIDFNAVLYLSYFSLDTMDVIALMTEARTKVYEHVVKANSIDEIMLKDTVNDVYGILYDIKGNAATPFQFFITDSSRNFIRGSLMFNAQANYDSLKPMIKYLKKDIENLISTTEWRNE